MTVVPDNTLLEQFIRIVGQPNVLTKADDVSRYTHENRGVFIGHTPLVLKPANTREVAAIVRLANESGTAIVPQGGHTGHAAGAVPSSSGNEIVVSLERMNQIREIDLKGNTAIVEAGVVLKNLQEAAAEHGRLFPLSLAAEGSCQIGGNIATNAGGTAVLAYGNTRDLVLGLEVVLPSGAIWHGLKRLKKDNTGYDLRDLIIGSEGTLGIITAAVVKLFPKPKGRVTAFCGLKNPETALAFFNRTIEQCGKELTAFELMAALCIKTVTEFADNINSPLSSGHKWYVLAEFSSGRSERDAIQLAESALAGAMDDGLIEDAVIANSLSQSAEIWRLREEMPLSQKSLGGSIKHDISVAVHLLPEFIDEAQKRVEAILPQARFFTFGHMGDGNLHYNVSQPIDMSHDDFAAYRDQISETVYQLVIELDGSISAEHGIGKIKRELLHASKTNVEIDTMRAIKQALDPNGIMNPGKIV